MLCQAASMVALLSAATAALRAQPASQRHAAQEVRAVHDRFQAAVLANDVAILGERLAPDYLFFTATGETYTRDDVLRIYGAKELAHALYRTDSVRVRTLSNDAAVVTAVLVKQSRYVSGPRSGTEVRGRFRSTRVYARRGAAWQVVSTHESRIGTDR